MQRVGGGGGNKEVGLLLKLSGKERRRKEKDLGVTGHAFIKNFDGIYCVYVFAYYITFLEAG